MTTTYGSLPGVKITEGPGGITEVVIGREQKLFFIGVGESGANGDTNTVIPIEEDTQLSGNTVQTILDSDPFGAEADIIRAAERALDQGVDIDLMYGVMADTTSQSEADISASGTLSNTPLVEDADRVSFADANDASNELDVYFTYVSPSAPSTDDTVVVNPLTGEYEYTTSITTVDASYETVDWTPATQAAVDDLRETEFGIFTPLTHDEQVATDIDGQLETARENRFAMGLSVMPFEPNDTVDYTDSNGNTYPEGGAPGVDATSFSLPTAFEDTDRLFLFGPSAAQDVDKTDSDWGVAFAGHVAGMVASSAVADPIYNDIVGGDESLVQDLTRGEVKLLRDQRVIPLNDNGEVVRVEDNQSTYDWTPSEQWERDLFRRQVVDLTISAVYQTAQSARGNVLDDDLTDNITEEISDLYNDFIQRGLLQPGGQEANVTIVDSTTFEVSLFITPYGVAKGADVTLQIQV